MIVESFFNGEPFQIPSKPIRDVVDSLIRTSDAVSASIAFVRTSGVIAVSALREALEAKKATIYAGMDFGQTQAHALSMLIGSGSTVGVVRGHQLHASKANGTFHPKVWLGVKGDHAQALIGSSNLSAGAVGVKNTEVNVLFKGSKAEQLFQDLILYFAELKRAAEWVTLANLADIERELDEQLAKYIEQLRLVLDEKQATFKVAFAVPEAGTVRVVDHVGTLKPKATVVAVFDATKLPSSGDHVYFSSESLLRLPCPSTVALVRVSPRAGMTDAIVLCRVALEAFVSPSPDAFNKERWDWELVLKNNVLRPFVDMARVRVGNFYVLEVLESIGPLSEGIRFFPPKTKDWVSELSRGLHKNMPIRFAGSDNVKWLLKGR